MGVCVCACTQLSHVQLFATPWTITHQAPLSMEFSWQEYWSGLPFPTPGDLPNPGIKCVSPALTGFFTTASPGKPKVEYYSTIKKNVFNSVLKRWNLEPITQNEVGQKFRSVARSGLTLCDPMDCSTPGFPVHHQLPELTQVHVH